jgi:hypothetical protein
VEHHAMLAAWESYYVIVGTSAAALTGLQFVVMALVADTPGLGSADSVDAFGTPTIVHFGISLFVAALLSAPWAHLTPVLWILIGAGIVGTAYTLIVLRRARQQTGYVPVFEDWLWHGILPMVSYGALIAAGAILHLHPEVALFLVAAVTLMLIYIGIHNAWDSVAYIAVQRRPRPPE